MVSDSINDLSLRSNNQIMTMDERINKLENNNLQKDLLIFGLQDNRQGATMEEENNPSSSKI